MKSMSSLDICAVLTEIKESLIGGSVINIYDVSKKIFLLFEAGIRIYLTQFMQSKNAMPSGFTMKLRKHLKGKRINKISQLGFDRVVDFTFGFGDYEHHLIIQFYVSGNIFLTDNNYKILTSLRQHVPELNQSNDNIYPILESTNKLPINPQLGDITVENIKNFLKIGNYVISEMKRIIPSLSNSNIKHFISNNHQINDDNIDQIADTLVSAIGKILDLLETIKNKTVGGFITVDSKYSITTPDLIPATALTDYSPYIIGVNNPNTINFKSYNECLDFYYGKFETFEKPTKKLSKADKIKIDQEKRIVNMQNQVKIAERNANLIDLNSAIVDECISLMRSLIASGSKWEDIWDEIVIQKQMGHEIAMRFDRVDFKKGEIYLNLKESSDDESYTVVPVSVNHSVFSNLRGIHNMRKTVLAKIDRTGKSMVVAIEKAQKKVTKVDLSDKKIERVRVKKRYWFEKFKWFISSDDYLVLAGRDSIQNEILVKRYMETNDIYIHADIHGAASCIVKNNSSNQIPQRTLIEAGQFSVCNSNAWKSKFMISAWWVESSQVSKTPESGDYLPSGSFVIRGKKNFLPPSKLEMGLAIIYLNEKSINDNEVKEEVIDDGGEVKGEVEEGVCEVLEGEVEVQNDVLEGDNEVLEPKNEVQSDVQNQVIEVQNEFKIYNKSQKIYNRDVKSVSNNKKGDKLLRGQKSKKKRMKKYEDQDSDIEEIRMMLMGSIRPSEPKIEIQESVHIPRKPIIRDRPGIRPPPFTTAIISKTSYNEEIEISTDDIPYQCVSMCGPWEAISRYRLKIKLLPGNNKKGQIASDALNIFKKSENDSARGQLLGQLKTEDLTLVIISDCKLDKKISG